jgi:hypothetical protein
MRLMTGAEFASGLHDGPLPGLSLLDRGGCCARDEDARHGVESGPIRDDGHAGGETPHLPVNSFAAPSDRAFQPVELT